MLALATTDRSLVLAAREGSQDAIGSLFRRHWDGAFRAALAVTGRQAMAEDAAQEAFLAAVRALDRFDTDRTFEPWLRRIAVNRALNLLRGERRASRREELDAPLDWAEPESPHADLLGLVASLPEERRLVVALRYWLDYEPLEIAEALGVPVGTVHSRLARARAELRGKLEVAP